jgi:hypothetical protein
MGASRMSENEAKRIAQCYASQNGIREAINRVSFVDADDLPERLRSRGSFWVIAFEPPKRTDVVMEHDGVVLNVGDSDQSVSVVG